MYMGDVHSEGSSALLTKHRIPFYSLPLIMCMQLYRVDLQSLAVQNQINFLAAAVTSHNTDEKL